MRILIHYILSFYCSFVGLSSYQWQLASLEMGNCDLWTIDPSLILMGVHICHEWEQMFILQILSVFVWLSQRRKRDNVSHYLINDDFLPEK
jgi:hypothetical protein